MDFGLSSGGELLRLFDPDGELIDYVHYGVDAPWPNLTGREEMTIALSDPNYDNSLASSWSISDEKGGTPGQLNFTQLGVGQSWSEDQTHALGQNYPNPFSEQTTIYYTIARDSRVDISVYNLSGQLVTTLVDHKHTPGQYSCSWDGTNSAGNQVSGGIYLYRLSTSEYQETRRMILFE